jgi:hypothetical protein
MKDTPPFEPVPGRARRDGWTPQRQSAFIAALAESGRVAVAARAVGMTRESAYRLRARAGAEGFVAAWDAAVARHSRGPTPLDSLWHRAVHGLIRRFQAPDGSTVTHVRPDDAALLRVMRRVDAAHRTSERHTVRKTRFEQTS